MFRRVLISNRGEIALRVLRACRTLGIRTVAVHSEADADSPHLEEADTRICIGPARSAESYLNMAAVLQAAEQSECSALHPGYGFLSENALFAELCAQAKITFIGPPARAIRAMGDKAAARETMRCHGLPVIPGSRGTLRDIEEGREFAAGIGFPVLLKATAGGGGRGMRRVDRIEDFDARYGEASMEAEKAFSDPRLYLEKYIVDGRHIEFQIMADAAGHVVHLGERECSAQRRHQKLIEESPSPAMTAELREELGGKICSALAAVGYRNAGTMEFFRSPEGAIHFMEMNTRLQVEHPVTEMVTGRDLVIEQIRIAAGENLSFTQEEIALRGHAIECRINAEDPEKEFRPSPGLITVFDPPGEGAGDIRIRLDTHVRAGYRIPAHYDSLLGKLIVHGPTREDARKGMIQALRSFRIEGVPTTIGAHLRILESREFASGNYDTGLVGRLLG